MINNSFCVVLSYKNDYDYEVNLWPERMIGATRECWGRAIINCERRCIAAHWITRHLPSYGHQLYRVFIYL